MPRITPTLWFGRDIETAADFYVTLFPSSRVSDVSRYPDDFPDAAMARAAPSGSGPPRYRSMTVGTTCQENPQWSVTQPHRPSWPPSAAKASQ